MGRLMNIAETTNESLNGRDVNERDAAEQEALREAAAHRAKIRQYLDHEERERFASASHDRAIRWREIVIRDVLWPC